MSTVEWLSALSPVIAVFLAAVIGIITANKYQKRNDEKSIREKLSYELHEITLFLREIIIELSEDIENTIAKDILLDIIASAILKQENIGPRKELPDTKRQNFEISWFKFGQRLNLFLSKIKIQVKDFSKIKKQCESLMKSYEEFGFLILHKDTNSVSLEKKFEEASDHIKIINERLNDLLEIILTSKMK